MNLNIENIMKLYIATFGRVADKDGLDYWVYDSGLTIEEIAQSFFDQEETKVLYSESLPNEDFIKNVYMNIFNREPDQDGLDYWKHELDSGSIQKWHFIEAVKNGAVGEDKELLNLKTSIGLYSYNKKIENLDFTETIISDVDLTTNIETKYEQIDSYLNSNYLLRVEKFDDNGDGNFDRVNYYDYDKNGNQILWAKDNDNNGTIDYTSKDFYDDNNLLIKKENDYDLTNNELDWTSEYFYESNMLDNVISYSGDKKYINKYFYDSKGNTIKAVEGTYYSPNDLISEVYEYEYDINGNQTKISLNGNVSFLKTYDINNNLLTSSTGTMTWIYTYDVDNLLTSERVIDEARSNYEDGYEFSEHYNYEYDSKGNLISIVRYDSNNSIDLTLKHTYDENDNLISIKYYDANGSLTNQSEYVYGLKTYTAYLKDINSSVIVTEDTESISSNDTIENAQDYFINNYFDSSKVYTNVIDSVIDTQSELNSLYDLYIDTLEKSEYETTSAYNDRIQDFRNEQGTIVIKYDVDDSYNADTETLTVHKFNFSEDTLSFDYDLFADNNVKINNLSEFGFDYQEDDNETIFLKVQMPSSESQAINDKFYILVEASLTSNIPFAEHNFSTYIGSYNYVNVEAERIMLINGIDDTVYANFI